MNKLIITIISTLMLSVSGTVLAQHPDGDFSDRGKRQNRGMQSNPYVDQVMHAIKRLDLDDEQKTNIRSIMHTLKADSRDLMEQTRAGHLQLRALITAEDYDEAAVAALAEKEGNLATERMIVSSKALSEVYAQLTPEQQAELEAMATKRLAKRAERGERPKHRSAEG